MTKKIIVNCETNEVIEREMTKAELDQRKIDAELVAPRLIEIQNTIQAKALLLEKLGITEDEAELLLS